jgi:hypothetical protein
MSVLRVRSPFLSPAAFAAAGTLLVACGAADDTPDAMRDAGPPTAIDAGRDAGPAWAGWPACDTSATSQRLTFVHVNDMHGDYGLDNRGVSRWARIRGYYERVRAESPYTLFTDGGDDHEKGSVAELRSGGMSTMELVRQMGFDVRVLGNHDFAWSLDAVLAFSSDPGGGLVLSSNHRYTGVDADARWGAKDYEILQVGCLRVAFAGLVSNAWDERDRPTNDPFYPEISADYDYAAVARTLLAAHRGEADVTVLVNHIGLSSDEALAEALAGEVDVILSAHSHSLTSEPSVVGDTLIVQAGSQAQFVVRLDVDVARATGRVSLAGFRVRLAQSEAPSTAVNDAARALLALHAPEADAPIGHVSSLCASRCVATTAARAALDVWAADAAIIDMDTTWDDWSAGPLTQQMMVDAFEVERERAGTPGFNALYRTQVPGRVLTRVAATDPSRYVFLGPTTLDPDTMYDLVVQKRPALHPDEYLASGVVFDIAPTLASEVWETLDTYARRRRLACLAVDADVPIPDCTPAP